MRQVAAVLFLLLAVITAAATALWAYGKAFGTEFDICPGDLFDLLPALELHGDPCYSGWFGVAAFAALTFVLGLVGWRLLGGDGR